MSSIYGPRHWADYFEQCGGNIQSPINIDSSKHRINDGFDRFEDRLDEFDIHEYGDVTLLSNAIWDWDHIFEHKFNVSNNGHSIKFKNEDSANNEYPLAMLVNLFDHYDGENNTLANYYCLDSFHIHWGIGNHNGSEHFINNIHYAAEIHFVHYRCDFDNLGQAFQAGIDTNTSTLAVVGFLFELDDSIDDSEVGALSKVADNIAEIRPANTQMEMEIDLLDGILPNTLQYITLSDDIDIEEASFWYYSGSLTTPACNELVHWHVLNKKLKIKSSILNAFRTMRDQFNDTIIHNRRHEQNNSNTVFYFDFKDEDDGNTITTTNGVSGSILTNEEDDENNGNNSGKMLGADAETWFIIALIFIIAFVILFIGFIVYIQQHGGFLINGGRGSDDSMESQKKPLSPRSKHPQGVTQESISTVIVNSK